MQLGPYRLDSLLGKGGFGEVWKAFDTALNRFVAVKLLSHAEPEELARFIREAQTAASLVHPNIAAIHHAGEIEKRPFIAMQLIDGPTLAKLNRRPQRDMARILRDVARAVAFAHSKGIVHRDLKPQNIMIDGEGRVFVLDFGLARRTDVTSSLTASGVLVGTPAYMSPEQARGYKVDARSDVWSLGATLYEMLAGRPPFVAPDIIDLLMRVVAEDPAPIAGDLGTVTLKCLEKDPARRYPTAQAFADDLDRWLAGDPISARRPSIAQHVRKHLRKRPLPFAAAAAAIVACVALLGVQSIRARSDSRSHAAEAERLLAVGTLEALVEADNHARLADPALRARVREKLGRLALSSGDFALARIAGVPVAQVEAAEQAQSKHRATQIRAAMDDIGKDLPGDRTLEDYVFECVRYDDEQTVKMLAEAIRSTEGRTNEERQVLTFCFRVLGRLDRDSVVAPLAEALRRLTDEDLAIECGVALANTRRAGANDALFVARNRLGVNSRFWVQVRRLASRVPDAVGGVEPSTPIDLRNRALTRHEKGDLDGAIADNTRALEINDRDIIALNHRGLARRDKGDLDGAMADFARALEIDPRFATAYTNRGMVRHSKGDFDGAIDDFTRTIELDHGNGTAHSNRGSARIARRDLDGAIADFTRAIELDPKSALAHCNRGNARREKLDVDGAIADFTRAIQIDPKDANAPYSRGLARLEKRDVDGALEDFTRAIELDPKAVGAYHQRGAVRLEKRDWDGAMADWTRVIALDPGNIEPHINRGLIRHKTGNVDGAIEDWERALVIGPNHEAAANLRKAIAEARKGREK